jgi:putative hydrolase of the HAD superfamily
MRFMFFDVGGTLIEPYPSVGAIYERVGRRFGLDLDRAQIESVFQSVFSEHVRRSGDAPLALGKDEPTTHVWWRTLVFQIFDVLGFEGDREGLFQAYFHAFEDPDAWRVHDDVLPVLELLRSRGIELGIISNWDYRLPPLLERLGLSGYFEHGIISFREGVAKPSTELYRRALERIDAPPAEVRYVGDHRDLDLDPARAMGIDAYLIDRSGRSVGEPRVVRGLAELVTSG